MRISLKTIIFLWIGLFLIIGALLLNAYSRIKPDSFIALMSEQVQKNYPGTKLEVGKIDYQFSLDFNLNLQNIQLRRAGKLLGSIGKVELKVPWWLLLINRGNAQINLTKLDIYVDHNDGHEMKHAGSPEKPSQIKVTLPDYLTEARYTLRAKDVSIRDIHNARRYFTVSKLLVREFQYGKNSAFELNIPIEVSHGNSNYSSDLWLFGDVTPEADKWDFNYRGEFKTKDNSEKFQWDDIVIVGSAVFKPQVLDIQSAVDISIEQKPVGKGTLSATQEELGINFNFSEIPLSYFAFIYDEFQNPYLRKLSGTGEGGVTLEKEFKADAMNVSGKLAFDGSFEISPQNMVQGKWQLNFQNSRWETSFMSPKGEISFFRRSFMDMKKNKVTQYVEELGFSGLEFTNAIYPVANLGSVLEDPMSTYYATTVSFKNCILGNKALDGEFKYGLSPDQRYYLAELKEGGATNFKISYSKTSKSSLDLEFHKFPWRSEYLFLQPYFLAKEGNLDGKIEGRWTASWLTGTWLGDVSLTDVSESSGKFPDLLHRTLAVFDLKDKSYKKIGLNFSIKNNLLSLHSLVFSGEESGKITASLSSRPKGRSFMTLSYPNNKKWKPVKKEVGMNWLNEEEP